MNHGASVRVALLLVGGGLAACLVPGGDDPHGHRLGSPDGRLSIAIALPEPGSAAAPSWTLAFNGAPCFAPSRFGLVDEGGSDLLAAAELVDVQRVEKREQVPIPFGKVAVADAHCHEVQLVLRSPVATRVRLIARCYDDAFAFRYVVEAMATEGPLRLRSESTTFVPCGDPMVHASYLEHFRTSHEHAVVAVQPRAIAVAQLLDTPLTLQWPGTGATASITEAALRRFAGMSLRADGEGGFAAALSPRADGLSVVSPLPVATPWRVVLVGGGPGALLESTTLHCLNEPPNFDTTWIRPGKLTWPWWNGYLFEAERGEPILSLATNRRHLDWCQENGIAFHAVVADEADSPWYVQGKPGLFPGPATDATKVRPDLDLAAIRHDAAARGVRLWTWVHHGAVRGRVDAVFAALAAHGFAGVMVDFLDSDDQETVEFCEDVLAAAARQRVLVHFHGIHKPTGLERTFPNLMNHEGSLNLEYLKWSDRCTPEHTLRVAFTRLVAGPMDYHLGGFRAVTADAFVKKHVAPNVLGTRAHHLAMYVCFDNPAPMVADHPAAYRNEPGFDCLMQVPTWWDTTRVLDAAIGRQLVPMRVRDGVYWVGGLFAGEARDVEVPLDFLGPGTHRVRMWRDGDSADTDPDDLALATMPATAGDVLCLRVADGGGFVLRIEPEAAPRR